VLDPAATETVTVRQLLTHTGGFDGDLFHDTGRGDDAVPKLVAYMRTNARQVSPPGTLFSYCNSGYVTLGALIARLRGGTWESALRTHVIEPLGVSHMALRAEEAVLFRVAAGHLGDDKTVYPRWQLPPSNAPADATPTAAMRELVRFDRMQLADGVAQDGTRILPPGTFATMREPQTTLHDAAHRSRSPRVDRRLGRNRLNGFSPAHRVNTAGHASTSRAHRATSSSTGARPANTAANPRASYAPRPSGRSRAATSIRGASQKYFAAPVTITARSTSAPSSTPASPRR
jgi:CubicO group peptidase (beta-lactamase class C family)